MRITASAISLNVADVEASATWAQQHLGFTVAMAADGFSSLAHPEAGFNLIYLQTGLPTFKPASAAGRADGLLVVFTVEAVDADYARLQAAGVVHPNQSYAEPARPSGASRAPSVNRIQPAYCGSVGVIHCTSW